MLKHKKLIIVATLAVLILALVIYDLSSTSLTMSSDESAKSPELQPVPDVSFTKIDGSTIALRSLAGHKILLHFWASWCKPCREEFSNLLLQIANNDDGTILLAVSGDEKIEDIRKFIAPLMRGFKPIFVSGRVIIAQDPYHQLIEGVFQTYQYPETIVITPDFKMSKKVVGTYQP